MEEVPSIDDTWKAIAVEFAALKKSPVGCLRTWEQLKDKKAKWFSQVKLKVDNS